MNDMNFVMVVAKRTLVERKTEKEGDIARWKVQLSSKDNSIGLPRVNVSMMFTVLPKSFHPGDEVRLVIREQESLDDFVPKVSKKPKK